MHTTDGKPALLLMQAITLSTVDAARAVYVSTRKVTEMTVDAQFTGVGEQAEGLTQNQQLDFKNAKYLAHAQAGNLVVEVGLSVGGNTFAPKESLSTPAVAILKSTLAKVPTA
jgi:hypothetical protein